MTTFQKYKSIFGYETNDDNENQIDSYGVNHTGFSLRDEIAYQMARTEREDLFEQSYNNRGITQNYPQLGKNFWGNSAENNYGFGTSNIEQNIEQMKMNATLEQIAQNQKKLNEQNNIIVSTSFKESLNNNQFETNLNNAIRKFGIDRLFDGLYNLGYDAGQRYYNYIKSLPVMEYENLSSVGKAQQESKRLTPINISDINKHQYVSCVGAADGYPAATATLGAGFVKEILDLRKKWNNPKYGNNWQILQDSAKDLKNDFIGIANGLSALNEDDCDYLLPKEAQKKDTNKKPLD